MLKVYENKNIVIRKSPAVIALIQRLSDEERERYEAGAWEARIRFERACLDRQGDALHEYYSRQFYMDGHLYR